jgi:hypothetical protein
MQASIEKQSIAYSPAAPKAIAKAGRRAAATAASRGPLDLAHRPDEYGGVDDMADSAAVTALAPDAVLYGGTPPA